MTWDLGERQPQPRKAAGKSYLELKSPAAAGEGVWQKQQQRKRARSRYLELK